MRDQMLKSAEINVEIASNDFLTLAALTMTQF